jgi:hypothetical protein
MLISLSLTLMPIVKSAIPPRPCVIDRHALSGRRGFAYYTVRFLADSLLGEEILE